MLSGVAAPSLPRLSGRAAHERRGGHGEQSGQPCGHPVDDVVEPGRGPAETEVPRGAVADHRIEGVGCSITEQARDTGDGAPEQRCYDRVCGVLGDRLHGGARQLIHHERGGVPPDQGTDSQPSGRQIAGRQLRCHGDRFPSQRSPAEHGPGSGCRAE
jgi:hypothetical protein